MKLIKETLVGDNVIARQLQTFVILHPNGSKYNVIETKEGLLLNKVNGKPRKPNSGGLIIRPQYANQVDIR